MNPFRKVSRVPSPQKLLDQAFSRAMATKRPKGQMPSLKRYRIHEQGRVSTAVNVLRSRITKIVKEFPTIEQIDLFYKDLLELLVGVDKTRLALGKVQGTITALERIEEQINLKLQLAEHPRALESIRKEAFGRISSVMEQIKSDLKLLSKVRMQMKRIPDFDPRWPCVVIGGAPNAGKSSLVRIVSSGKPEIGAYPFTTRDLVFGHRDFGFIKTQFVDTPGLLDRPMEKRNKIEKQALIALRRVSDIILFLIDPSEYASLSIEEQLDLLQEITDFFDGTDIKVVINKIDITPQEQLAKLEKQFNDALWISTATRQGIEELLQYLNSRVEELIVQPKFKQEISKSMGYTLQEH